MKNRIFHILFTIITVLSFTSCSEYFNREPGEDYDILWPVPSVNIDYDSMTVDTEYTLTGENLDKVFQVFFGTDEATILDTLPAQIKIKTPRLFDKSRLTARNYYEYSYESVGQIIPRYLQATITKWPSSFKRKQSVTLEGENLDQLEVLLIGNVRVPVDGRSIEDPDYKKIIIPLTEVKVDSLQPKFLLKAIGLNGSFFEAPDSSIVLQ